MTTQRQSQTNSSTGPSTSIKTSPSSGDPDPQDAEMPDVRSTFTPESMEDGRSETAPSTAPTGENSSDIPIRATPQPEPTVNESLSILGQRPKLLLSAINELQVFGVDSTIPLPKIVVVGDQSAGKSSLIEAISEIKVPRDAGCCTRCPLQLNLRADEAANARWTCSISLVKKFAFSPDSDPSDNPLYPWIENVMPSATPFGTVYSKEQLEATIRRAQVATLNPQMPPHRFMNPDCSDNSIYVQFSPNIVSLEISAANIPNLSFYDLPGVISQSRDGRKDTISLVRELVRHYIGQENTLVLLAVPFESDIDNSKASAILSEENANDRTIGVLTKPDRLQSDDRVDNWIEVLRGEAFAKGHGYFVVKQPSQEEMKNGMSHADARAQEEAFFQSEFWTSRFQGFKDRLGTSNLQQVLSQKLAFLILQCLPTITEKVHHRLAEINEELKTLPDPPANALHCVNKVLADFGHRLRTKIDGDHNPNELMKIWKNARKSFLEDITINQRPLLLVQESLYNSTKPLLTSPAATLKLKQAKLTTPSKRGREAAIVLDSSDEEMAPTPSKKIKLAESLLRRPPQPFADSLKTRFRLDDIRDTLDDHSASGLPGSIEPKAVDRMILSAMVNWNVPLQALFKSLRGAIGHLFQETLNASVSEWRTTYLYKEMIKIMSTFIELHVGDLECHIASRALQVERTKPITNDVETLDRCEREERDIFRAARFKERSEKYFDKQDQSTGKTTSAEERERKRINKDAAEAIEKKIGTDPFTREVDVMAKIRGYYKIASTRFVDNICQAVEVDLFLKLRDGLQDDMEDGLRLTQPDCHEYATKLLDDDPARAERRIALKKQKEGLEQAVRRIRQLNKQI